MIISRKATVQIDCLNQSAYILTLREIIANTFIYVVCIHSPELVKMPDAELVWQAIHSTNSPGKLLFHNLTLIFSLLMVQK